MKIVNSSLIERKRVLIRYDIDVALKKFEIRNSKFEIKVIEDFKLRAGLSTLELCLKYAKSVIIMGHIGRPQGQMVSELLVEPVRKWFENQGYSGDLESGKFKILENLRFDPREEACDIGFAKELAAKGDVFVNEAFGSYRPAVSTTVLPILLPHAAGLRFAREVERLGEVRENPQKPFIAIMGGAKVKDKLPVIEALSQKADAVLVGGKLVVEIREQNIDLPKNVMVGKLNDAGFDVASETVDAWSGLISRAATIVWNGPLGKFEDPENDATRKIAAMVLESKAKVVIGGGDTVAALDQYDLLQEAERQAFVSVGGGAMLRFLASGTLATIETLK